LSHINSTSPTHPSCAVDTMNLHFINPVGLAAGFDRDGKKINDLNTAGFGFIEIGTVNVDSEIKFDDGLENIILNLEQSRKLHTNRALLGISLGSLRNSIDDNTIADYLHGMEKFWHHSDYIVINLSRPGSSMRSETSKNTALRRLLEKIKQKHIELSNKNYNHVPIVIKAAIDYKIRKTLPEVLTIANEFEFDGLLVAFENWPSSTDVKDTISDVLTLSNNLPLIVVGGIKSADDALQILKAGAKLVQCYSLFADKGSLEIQKIIRKLTLLEK